MSNKDPRRKLIVCSRLADGYGLTAHEEKAVRQALIQWIPQAVFADLPDEATRIDVEVRRGQYGYQGGNQKVYRVSFFQQDGSLIPVEENGRQVTFKDYAEDLIVGKRLPSYDSSRDTEYQGKVMGVDFRLVYYKSDDSLP